MKRLAIVIALLLAAATSVFAQADLQPLAVVKLNKSETITLKQLKSRVAFVQKTTGLASLTAEQKTQLLNTLIQEKLIVQAAAKEGLSIPDSQVDSAFLNTFSQQLGQPVTESQLKELVQKNTGMSLDDYMIQQSGFSVSEYKAYLKTQLIAQQYVVTKKSNELNAIAPSDEEIRNFYKLNKSSFHQNPMMKLFLVIVPKGSDSNAAKATCVDLRNQYKASAANESKIKESAENGKKYQAGNLWVQQSSAQAQVLGWDSQRLLELFEKKVGFVSEINETASDWQFYAVLKKTEDKNLELSDVVQPETTVTVYDYIKATLTQQSQLAYLNQAVVQIAKELDTPANVERKKTGDALLKLMNW